MKYVIIIVLALVFFIVGYRCNHKQGITVCHHVAIPSTNHYEITGDMIVKAPLPRSTPVEYSTDGITFSRVGWGNETFGDSSFGWYQLHPKSKHLWLRILPDKANDTNKEACVVFVENE